MTDARLALRARGLLRTFNELGVLHAADVHVASRLGALGGEPDEAVLLAAALAVRGVRQGSVVLRLADVAATVTADDPAELGDDVPDAAALPWPALPGWSAAVAASRLVATSDADAGRPLRLEDGGLWLDRHWRQEGAVAAALVTRAAATPEVDPAALRDVLARLWPGERPDDQRAAAAVCLLTRASVLGGGPGTGKTTTVARLLAALRALAPADRPPRVALAAPTGKAAARLQEAVVGAAATAAPDDAAFLRTLSASTVHRLLQLRPGAAAGPEVRLPHDVVVVDEASMLSLALFARLLASLRPSCRLLLVGDPDQLASVEAGAVLADLVAPARDGARTPGLAARLATALPHDSPGPVADDGPTARVRDGVALLSTGHRFSGALDDLAGAVRSGDPDRVLGVLRAGDPAVRFVELPDTAPLSGEALAHVRAQVLAQARAVVGAATAGSAEDALAALGGARLLCAHRHGPRGVAACNALALAWSVEELGVRPRADGHYPGQPLLVTANDPDNRVSNGDTAVVLERDGGLVAAFDRAGAPHLVPLVRLAQVRPLHALTVHRAQGSQFDVVTVLLPAAASPLGTRETLYTAVTRARSVVHVLGSPEAVAAAVTRPVLRATGLRARLAGA